MLLFRAQAGVKLWLQQARSWGVLHPLMGRDDLIRVHLHSSSRGAACTVKACCLEALADALK